MSLMPASTVMVVDRAVPALPDTSWAVTLIWYWPEPRAGDCCQLILVLALPLAFPVLVPTTELLARFVMVMFHVATPESLSLRSAALSVYESVLMCVRLVKSNVVAYST